LKCASMAIAKKGATKTTRNCAAWLGLTLAAVPRRPVASDLFVASHTDKRIDQ
jgi:hypothetical protein